MLLALDTATQYAGIALYDGQQVVVEQTWLSNRNHTIELMPAIMKTLQHVALKPVDLQGFAVSLGPGSFTGLRIGLSVAKGLAMVTGKPLLGVPTLDILGYAYAGSDMPTCAILQAGRTRLCVATYMRSDTLKRLDAYRIIARRQLAERLDQATFFCGEIDAPLADMLRKTLGSDAHIASPAATLRRPGYLAEIGWQRLKQGERDNLATLSPLYLQHPAAGARE